MEWTEDTILLLINLYRHQECLWNAKHSLYYNKLRKYDSWVQIAAELNTTVEECKKKITNLLSAFRREKAKVKKSIGTGKGSDEIYESNWFAYKNMEFLLDKNCPRETLSTIPDEGSQPATESAEASDLSDAEQGQVVSPVSPRPSTSLGPGPSSGPIPKKLRKNDVQAEKLDKAFQILQASSARNKEDSECALFGKLIAKKLESYTKVARIAVQQAVMGIMFQADSGFYDRPQPPQPGPVNLPQPNFQYVYYPNPTSNIIHHPERPQSYASVSPISSQSSSYSQDQPRNFQQAQFCHPISPQEYHESSPSVSSPPECSPANPSSEVTTFEELVQSTLGH